MRFDSVAWGILKRKVLAWLRLKFGTKPLPIPKLTGPVRIWAGVDTDREEADYLRNTTAFWLRPDRGSFDMPCWMIEGEYVPKQSTAGIYLTPLYGNTHHPAAWLGVGGALLGGASKRAAQAQRAACELARNDAMIQYQNYVMGLQNAAHQNQYTGDYSQSRQGGSLSSFVGGNIGTVYCQKTSSHRPTPHTVKQSS